MADVYPWQAELWARIWPRRQHPHAYLLHGPRGIGKRDLAERLAQLLLCQSPQGAAPCGQCKACALLKAGTHPDYCVIQPEEAEKPIRVDQIRALVDFVTQTAQLGGRKLILLEPVEAMNLNAANALLKSLEEPSGATVLLLVSHQPSRLLPTVRSRCVQQACPVPTRAASLAWLGERLPELDEEVRTQLLVLAGGSPLAALRLHGEEVLARRALVVDGVKRLLKRQAAPSQLAESWNAVPLPLLLDWFCEWTHGVLRQQWGGADAEAAPDMAKVLGYLAEKTTATEVMAVQEWLHAERQKVLGKANLNRVLLLESLLIRWAGMVPGR